MSKQIQKIVGRLEQNLFLKGSVKSLREKKMKLNRYVKRGEKVNSTYRCSNLSDDILK